MQGVDDFWRSEISLNVHAVFRHFPDPAGHPLCLLPAGETRPRRRRHLPRIQHAGRSGARARSLRPLGFRSRKPQARLVAVDVRHARLAPSTQPLAFADAARLMHPRRRQSLCACPLRRSRQVAAYRSDFPHAPRARTLCLDARPCPDHLQQYRRPACHRHCHGRHRAASSGPALCRSRPASGRCHRMHVRGLRALGQKRQAGCL